MSRTITAILISFVVTPPEGFASQEKNYCAEEITTIKKSASDIWKLSRSDEFASSLPLTNPKLIEIAGGKDKYLEIAKRQSGAIKTAGLQYESIKTKAISQTYRAGPYYVCILPIDYVFQKSGRRFLASGYLVASRTENSPWTFLDGSGVSKNPSSLQVFFPGFPSNVVLPQIDLGRPL